jgi:hypothetical protein
MNRIKKIMNDLNAIKNKPWLDTEIGSELIEKGLSHLPVEVTYCLDRLYAINKDLLLKEAVKSRPCKRLTDDFYTLLNGNIFSFAVGKLAPTFTATESKVVIEIAIGLDSPPGIDDIITAVRAGKYDWFGHDESFDIVES